MVAARWDRAAIESLVGRALAEVHEGEAEVLLTARDAALTRFANSRIHQNVAEHDATIRVRVVADGRTGVASTNRTDADGLRDVAARAVAICRHATPNPGGAPLSGPVPSTAPPDLGFAEATALSDPEMRAVGARAVIVAGDAGGLETSGAFSTETTMLAIANSRGMWNSHTVTQAKLLTVMMDGNGASGYAQATDTDVRAIDATALGEEAADK
ncbi:MAG: hypothetical protein OEW24_08425, partial [Chloroflexota bacterium]|nr:hypothetical protein [Chloroflexota bacterium]